MKYEKLMTPAEVAERLQVSVPFVRVLVKKHKLQAVRIGHRCLRFRPEAVELFLRRNLTTTNLES